MTTKEHALLALLERTLPHLERLSDLLTEPEEIDRLITAVREATVLAVMEE